MTATGYLAGDPSKVSKTGYAKGDILAADGTGTLSALPIGVNSRALTVDTAKAQDLDYIAGGGAPVSSVFTRTGAVVAVSGDYTVGQVTGAAPLASPTFTGTATFSGREVVPSDSLTDAATIATDASLGNYFRVTLNVAGATRLLGNPTNLTDGQKIIWELIQDGVGNRALTLDTKFALGTDITAVTLSTAAGKRDFLGAIYNSTADKLYIIAFVKGY